MLRKFANLSLLLFGATLVFGVIGTKLAHSKELPDFTDLVEKQGAAVVNISTIQILQGIQGIPTIPENDPSTNFSAASPPRIRTRRNRNRWDRVLSSAQMATS